MVRRRAADGRDVAYTYNRILDGGPEAATWGSYLNRSNAEATDPTTLVLTLKKPQLHPAAAADPDRPGAHLEGRRREGRQDLHQRAGGRPARRRVRAVPAGRGQRRRLDVHLEANPDYWGGAPHIDQVVFRVYKSQDPMIQALIKGEVDFVDGINAAAGQVAAGPATGITAQNGDSPSFDEIAFNTGAVDTKTGDPIGDGNPALQDTAFRHALGYAIDTQTAHRQGLPGRRRARLDDHPAGLQHLALGAARPTTPTPTTPTRPASCSTTAGYTMGADGLRTMPDGSPIGTLRLPPARSRRPRSTR